MPPSLLLGPIGHRPDIEPKGLSPEISFGRDYAVRDGCTVRLDCDRDGNERVDVLATFVARIEEEITIDDGVETSRLFRISCRLRDGTRPRDAVIPAAEFEGLTWVLRSWGLRAVMFSGAGRRDHLRTAIQLMSSEATCRTVYTHTGWRQYGGDWIYLYQGGAVGADDVEVRLDPPFERFALPAQTENVRGAIETSLSLLDCGPPDVAVPLLAAVYAAPLSFILNPDFAVWLVGPTGSLKSELASLAQRHFGPFTRKTLPGSWCSTGNSLESLLAVTKDMLAVIDDFAPQADAQTQREQTKRAEILLRNVGNHAGRGRLRPDLSQRPVRPPRGLIVCTGESHPPTPSIVARLVLVPVNRARLDMPAITRLQASGDRLRQAMRAYIEWLRPRLSELQQALPSALATLMTEEFSAASLGSHLRAPGGLATLYLGLKTFLEFAVEHGVLSGADAVSRLAAGRGALLEIGKRQAEVSRERTPAARFIDALAALLSRGRVWIGAREGTPVSHLHGASTEFIGWRDREYTYLLPEPAFRAVTSFLRDAGDPLGVSASRLYDSLLKSGLTMPGPSDRVLHQLRFPSGRHRVVVISNAVIARARGSVDPEGERQDTPGLVSGVPAARALPGPASPTAEG